MLTKHGTFFTKASAGIQQQQLLILFNTKAILMKSILFIAFLALATIGCDTPEKSTGSDTAPLITNDTAVTAPSGMDTDTSTITPTDTTTQSPNPTDTTKNQ